MTAPAAGGRLPRIPLRPEVLLRLAADAVLLNLALAIAFTLRFLWLVGVEGDDRATSEVLRGYARAYLTSSWVLTLVGLIVFWSAGFYHRSRAYRGRYKALVVAQAVSLTYVIFGTLSYFAGGLKGLPRSSFLLAWGLTLVLVVGARLWAYLWAGVVKTEMRLFPLRPEERKVQTVLVIGGAGYIGSALLPRLLEAGYRVRLLDLLIYGTDPIAAVASHRSLQVLQADFRQVDRVVEAMQGVDAVIHLGGIVGDPACDLDEKLTIEVNLMATHMIAEVAKGSGVSRFLFASTCSVYGAGDAVLDEGSPLNPVSLYARSKIASERALRRLASDEFGPTILRFGTVYGLSGRIRFDLVVNLLAAKALVDGEITVFGGDQWRPFLHVDDAARAVLMALQAPFHRVRDQVFNVGSEAQNHTIQAVAEIIHGLVPQAKIVNRGAGDDRRDYRVSFARIRRELGFAPAFTVADGARQVIRAIHEARVADYRDPRYSNVKFMRAEAASRLVNFPRPAWLTEESQDLLEA